MIDTISSPGASAVRFTPTMNSLDRHRAPPGRRRQLDRRRRAPPAPGSPSPAGEQVPRLPPSVPALRICGDPTVRAAWASAGTIDASGPVQHLAVRDRGADRDRAVPRSCRHDRSSAIRFTTTTTADRASVPVVDLDHQVGAAGEHGRRRVAGQMRHGVVDGVGQVDRHERVTVQNVNAADTIIRAGFTHRKRRRGDHADSARPLLASPRCSQADRLLPGPTNPTRPTTPTPRDRTPPPTSSTVGIWQRALSSAWRLPGLAAVRDRRNGGARLADGRRRTQPTASRTRPPSVDHRRADLVGRPLVPRARPARVSRLDPAEHHLRTTRGPRRVLPASIPGRSVPPTSCCPAATRSRRSSSTSCSARSRSCSSACSPAGCTRSVWRHGP